MNRIDQLFSLKKDNILSIYLTAGYPARDDAVPSIELLEKNGADLIEIGIPFSDPLADGEVIQKSSQMALANGMSLALLFEQLKDIRSKVQIPLIMMGYLNPILQFGFERFIKNCREVGIDGLILPDLPLEVYKTSYKSILDEAGIKFIMLITPQTSEERIKAIAEASGGFIYMVSDASTTGARKELSSQQVEYFKRIEKMKLELPRLIGFGISNADTFREACKYANGAIIGSAFISAMENNSLSLEEKIPEFLKQVLE